MQKGDHVSFVVDEGDRPIPARVVKEDTDGWVALTTELEYQTATLMGQDPEPLILVRKEHVRE